MNRVDKQTARGFTLVELLLAMTFISILMLTIAATVIQIINTYNKGLTLRAVDQAGRGLTSDMRRVIGTSEPFQINSNFRLQRNQTSNPTDYDGGRLCTGTFTYVWNFGKSLAKNTPVNNYDSNNGEIRFVRVRDAGGEYCANPNQPIRQADATELLSSGDRDLALQSFSITQLAQDTTVGQALYRIVMEIGTNDQSTLDKSQHLDTIDTNCKPPSDAASLTDFCAVNRFDFTAQAGNKGGP